MGMAVWTLTVSTDVLVLSLSLSRTLDWAHDQTFPEISGHAASVALARHNIASLLCLNNASGLFPVDDTGDADRLVFLAALYIPFQHDGFHIRPKGQFHSLCRRYGVQVPLNLTHHDVVAETSARQKPGTIECCSTAHKLSESVCPIVRRTFVTSVGPLFQDRVLQVVSGFVPVHTRRVQEKVFGAGGVILVMRTSQRFAQHSCTYY
ncbi:hypothetical protein FA13DRAFT_1143568 [Coprinellus micaceus]|uniref:Secreted protein n=1 Tax=Coprinellus micaceus TaxID=71717 RepID=A0A4Y7SVX1_COPMI|nr:hypothetical protein FA13DRAFT_1143568 [Coprinellus micaceus]